MTQTSAAFGAASQKISIYDMDGEDIDGESERRQIIP
jgi:hypothetical protein